MEKAEQTTKKIFIIFIYCFAKSCSGQIAKEKKEQ